MQVHEFELSVGDVLHIDDRIVTVIDIDGEEVSLRVDYCSQEYSAAPLCDSTTKLDK